MGREMRSAVSASDEDLARLCGARRGAERALLRDLFATADVDAIKHKYAPAEEPLEPAWATALKAPVKRVDRPFEHFEYDRLPLRTVIVASRTRRAQELARELLGDELGRRARMDAAFAETAKDAARAEVRESKAALARSRNRWKNQKLTAPPMQELVALNRQRSHQDRQISTWAPLLAASVAPLTMPPPPPPPPVVASKVDVFASLRALQALPSQVVLEKNGSTAPLVRAMRRRASHDKVEATKQGVTAVQTHRAHAARVDITPQNDDDPELPGTYHLALAALRNTHDRPELDRRHRSRPVLVKKKKKPAASWACQEEEEGLRGLSAPSKKAATTPEQALAAYSARPLHRPVRIDPDLLRRMQDFHDFQMERDAARN